jgi:hypothetical protein
MPMEIVPPLVALLLVATGVQAMELLSAIRGPRCPQCVHCRLEAASRKAAEQRDEAARAARRWGLDDADDEEFGPRS